MESLIVSEAKANWLTLIEQVNKDHLPRQITSKKGDAVLVSKQEWDGLQETLYLQSIPGLVQSIIESEAEDDWVSQSEFFKELSKGLHDE